MRVLFASTHPHLPDAVGGLQTTTDELCLALARFGAKCAVLAGKNENTVITGSDKNYPIARTVNLCAGIENSVYMWKPDIIVVQSGPDMCSLLAHAVETGLPVCCYLHNVESQMLGGTLFNHPRIKYISNSQFTAQRWKLMFGIDSEVVVPYIELSKYAADRRGDHVLFVNPVPVKGLEIAFRLADAFPKIPFLFLESWVIPTGLRGRLENRIAHLPNVQLQSATSDMREVFGKTKVLLMPSLWEEAFGRTVIEAQINGIPVLASNRGALPKTVGLGGITLDPHGPFSDWIEVMNCLYNTEFDFTRMEQRVKKNAATSGCETADIEFHRVLKNHIGAVAHL